MSYRYNSWNNEMEEYEGKYIHHTDEAILFLPDTFEEGEEVWLPLSQIEHDENLDMFDRGDPITLEIKNWIAEDKGII